MTTNTDFQLCGQTNCGCVHHAEDGIPCVHDLAKALNDGTISRNDYDERMGRLHGDRSKARLDAAGDAKPLTRIVHHPPAGACFGPGMSLHRPEYEAADGTRTLLDGGFPAIDRHDVSNVADMREALKRWIEQGTVLGEAINGMPEVHVRALARACERALTVAFPGLTLRFSPLGDAHKIDAIKAIRMASGFGLRDGKDAMESGTYKARDEAEARVLAVRLKECGFHVRIE